MDVTEWLSLFTCRKEERIWASIWGSYEKNSKLKQTRKEIKIRTGTNEKVSKHKVEKISKGFED